MSSAKLGRPQELRVKSASWPRDRRQWHPDWRVEYTLPSRYPEDPQGSRQPDRQRRDRLEAWFAEKRRQFPWRQGLSPWGTFVAEMLLRRTRADQVARNLPRVLERYPGPKEMASASLADVEATLKPFGLYWRARTLHAAAARIVAEHSSAVPHSVEELVLLPGVGPYVAAATVAALADEDVVLVDTNTVRVATRVAGSYRAGDIRRRRDVQQAIHNLLGGPAPALAWWAVLDLAAAICTAGQPTCSACPIRDLCLTGASGLI